MRNDRFVGIANGINDFLPREDAGDVAQPALQYLHVNPEGESVESADLNFLTPMRRSIGVQVIAGEALQPHMMWPADIILGQNLFDQQISLHSEWRRAKHGHQPGITRERRK